MNISVITSTTCSYQVLYVSFKTIPYQVLHVLIVLLCNLTYLKKLTYQEYISTISTIVSKVQYDIKQVYFYKNQWETITHNKYTESLKWINNNNTTHYIIIVNNNIKKKWKVDKII